MKKKTVWNGEHQGINFEIQNFKMGGVADFPETDCWTFYLYISLDQLPDELKKRFWLDRCVGSDFDKRHVSYNYPAEPLISDLNWHCECTWYSKESGFDGSPRLVKIGCDYQHYLDKGKYYCVEQVKQDAMRCIDSLVEAIPNMKQRCGYCGAYNRSFNKKTRRCDECKNRD